MIKYTPEEQELLDLDILAFFEYKYFVPRDELFDNEIYYLVYDHIARYYPIKGGRGSGKSREIVGKLPVVYVSCCPFRRIVIVRKHYNSIKGSSFQEIIDYLEFWNLKKYFKINASPMKITHIESGNYITFAGMDKPDSIKSIKDATDVIFEECFQIDDEEGVMKVEKSIRTPKVDDHRFYFVFNPDNTDHWLYRKFYDPDLAAKYQYFRRNAVYLTTTYRDNKFLPDNFVELLEADRIADPERAIVDCDGEFGNIRRSGLWYPNFNPKDHVIHGLKEDVYDKKKALYLTFDFNVYPYISLEVGQYRHNTETNDIELCVIDEICIHEKVSPTNAGKIKPTIDAWFEKYWSHEGDVYVCGDRSGHNKKTNATSDYATIFAMLRPTKRSEFQSIKDGNIIRQYDPYPEYQKLGCTFKVIDRTIHSQNPRLDARNLFFRRLMAGTLSVLPVDSKFGTKGKGGQTRALSRNYAGSRISLRIDSRCTYLIKDYNEVVRKEDGKKDEGNKEITHTSDAVDYLATELFKAEYKKTEADLTRNR